MHAFKNLTVVILTAFSFTSCDKEPPPPPPAPVEVPKAKAKPERSSFSSGNSVLSRKNKQKVGRIESKDSGLGSVTLKRDETKKNNKKKFGSSLSNSKNGKENKVMIQGTR